MSGFIGVSPIPIFEFALIGRLLAELGYDMVKASSQVKALRSGWAKGSMFRSPNGVEIEVGVTKEGKLQLFVDEEQLRAKEGIEEKDLAEQIVQGYTYKKVIEKLQAQGYTLVEEQQLDEGTIKLVVRRWS